MNSLDDSVALITRAACATIDRVDYASVSLLFGGGGMATLGSTAPLVLKLDSAQAELREGPGLDAATGGVLTHSDDVPLDPRWPRYGLRAAELGVRAQTAVPLPGGVEPSGCLNLYSICERVFDDGSAGLALMFAAQVSLVIDLTSRVETLTEAVQQRQTIAQAIGIVRERLALDERRAFEHLVGLSQASQVKLRFIARELVEHSSIPYAGRGTSHGD